MDGNNTTINCIDFMRSKKMFIPDDTALIKGTDRGTFIGSPKTLPMDRVLMNYSAIRPVSSALMEKMDLLQDPFWTDPDALLSAEDHLILFSWI